MKKIKNFTPGDCQVWSKYLDGKKPSRIAVEMNFSREYVKNKLDKIGQRLQQIRCWQGLEPVTRKELGKLQWQIPEEYKEK